MTDTELRAAAEMVVATGMDKDWADTIDAGALAVCRAWLAEHPADDDATTGPPFDEWSFIRDVLSRGAAIEADNRELTYERFSAKLDAAASELADRLKPHLRATP